MNILVDVLPSTLQVDGSTYAINTDFRIGIMFEQLMIDKTIQETEKPYLVLNLFFTEEIPPNIDEAIRQVLSFYSREDVTKPSDTTKSEKVDNQVKRIYSFDHDDAYIYSAFLTQYGIDLQDIEELHWWKFKAMFTSLNEDLLFSKIMGYRSVKISNDMTSSDKKYYKKMKKVYALPDERTEEEKEADFHDSLAGIF